MIKKLFFIVNGNEIIIKTLTKYHMRYINKMI